MESSRYWLLLASNDWTRVQFTRPGRRWQTTYRQIYPDKYTVQVKSVVLSTSAGTCCAHYWLLILLISHQCCIRSAERCHSRPLHMVPSCELTAWARHGPPRDDGYTDLWTGAHQALAGRREEKPYTGLTETRHPS